MAPHSVPSSGGADSPPRPPRTGPSAERTVPDDLVDRLVLALTCAAVDGALSGVLLFDLEPRLVDPVARLFARILAGPAGPAAPWVMLGTTSRDEDLWTRARISRADGGITFRTEPGPLIEGDRRPGPPPLVVVPDLVRLSVSGMRAAVQLLGADVAVVEHTGLSHTARPRARWLVGCSSAEAGRLSPHLLDRFALRLPVAGLRLPPDERLRATVDTWSAAPRRTGSVTVTDEAVARVGELLGHDPSVRRELALARLARAVAAVQGERAAGPRHCDTAAHLIGLPLPDPPRPTTEPEARSPGVAPPPLRSDSPPRDRLTAPAATGGDEQGPGHPRQRLLATEPAEPIGDAPSRVPLDTPFPEDEAEVLRDFAPLRSPWQRTAGPASTRGAVVGTRRAGDLRDFAYVRTVQEAALHQRVRGTERFTVSAVDLHSHVRSGTPERMLVLLLDHTCRDDDWDWQLPLAPFLQWAYTERAAVQTIEVGDAHGVDELRARSSPARNVLDRRVSDALRRQAGRATPLAHGLEEAVRVLQRAFRQHGSGLAEAWVVVVTDGRGNVPLHVSHTGRLQDQEVGATGVTDALDMARWIAAMDRTRVHTVVVDPGSNAYGHLPGRLADALGGIVVEGRGPEDDGTGRAADGAP
ncbi:magnesium chelatase [Streptomyces longwoodensis]|uniref:magnesium chelatase n=1 Tax=Streptomyces longwoodensis TaxID=68231 RepID=UPI0037F39A1E